MPYKLLTPMPPMPRDRAPLVVNLGAGVDSTAMLIWMHRLGIRPDAIVFAWVGAEDFGNEHPETYTHLSVLSAWLQQVGFPAISIITYVNAEGRYQGLWSNSIANATLPSASFGRRGCSAKHKAEPIDRALLDAMPLHAEAGRLRERLVALAIACPGARVELLTLACLLGRYAVIRCIGFGWVEYTAERQAHELGRACRQRSTFARPDRRIPAFRWTYPLQDWRMSREESEQLCREALGYCPRASSCFFCAAMTQGEILDLAREHPGLARACVLLEQIATPKLRDQSRGLSGRPRTGRYSSRQSRWLSLSRPGRWTEIWRRAGLLDRVLCSGPTFVEAGLPKFIAGRSSLPDFGVNTVTRSSVDRWLSAHHSKEAGTWTSGYEDGCENSSRQLQLPIVMEAMPKRSARPRSLAVLRVS